MEFDDELGEEGPSAPLLPAPDRLWRHPSEVGLGIASRGSVRTGREPRLLAVAVLAATVGAVLAAGGTVMAGGLHSGVKTVAVPALERHVEPVTVALQIKDTNVVIDVFAITQRIRLAIVGLEVLGPKRAPAARGSGVIFRSDGYLLTDARVVAGATVITVVLADRRHVAARIVGTDPETGVAVLKIAGSGYEVAALGSTDDLEVGQPAIAIGAAPAGGSVGEVQFGVVRALGSSMDEGDGRQLQGMIQTDARAAPGAAGGALVDANGVVIGITTGWVGGAGSGDMATPIDLAYAVASQLMRSGRVDHVWLGIDGRDVDPAAAKSTGLIAGALIDMVHEASPASVSGLQVGDVVTAVDSRDVTSMSGLLVAVRTHSPGERVFLHVRRGAEKRVMSVVLGVRPPGPT